MTREWKPGDVALATVRGVPDVCVFRVHKAWVHLPPGNEDRRFPATYCALYDNANEVTDVRPLVVIDPEDREQVERLADYLDVAVADAEYALRSLVAPPRPPEPTGLGAVVEDAAGNQYVRTDRGALPWFTLHAEGNAGRCDWTRWDLVDAVRVLSEGATP